MRQRVTLWRPRGMSSSVTISTTSSRSGRATVSTIRARRSMLKFDDSDAMYRPNSGDEVSLSTAEHKFPHEVH